MIFVVSGEGSSDIGSEQDPGPMAVIIDKLVEREASYSLLDSAAMEFVAEGSLAARARELPMAISAGKKRDYETGYHFKGARALARYAAKRKAEETSPVEFGVVFFRDTDLGQYEIVRRSMEHGFRAEGFANGVPMVPKPKSEAWMICALKKNSYENCEALEESLPGNDDAPNPAKAQLKVLLDVRGKDARDLSQMVGDGEIDPGRIEMPSFADFRNRLRDVTRSMLGLPPLT